MSMLSSAPQQDVLNETTVSGVGTRFLPVGGGGTARVTLARASAAAGGRRV
ncbi:hypothetical protein Cma02nite_19590 [Cellulomonas marina]|nr:hypothetical protein Cma02nite_19590 [Cellulomonas marina]